MTVVVQSADNFNHALQHVSQFSIQTLPLVLDFNVRVFRIIRILCSHDDIRFSLCVLCPFTDISFIFRKNLTVSCK
jgi:hypothetical protein